MSDRTTHPRSAHPKGRHPWRKIAIEAGIALLLGVAALGLSLRWVGSLGFFVLGFDAEAVKAVSIRTECVGKYTATIVAKVEPELHQIWQAANPDSPGMLSVVIRRDSSDAGPSGAFCTKFWLMTSSRETAEEGTVHGIFVNGGKETAGPDEKTSITNVANSFQREFAFSTVKLSSDPVALSMEVAFRRMAVGLGYGKKIVSLAYEPHGNAVAPTIQFVLPFSFEVNTAFPASEQLSVRKNGVVLITTPKPEEPAGVLITDSSMMQDKENVLFLAAALLGTGIALIAEFCRAIARLLLPRGERDG